MKVHTYATINSLPSPQVISLKTWQYALTQAYNPKMLHKHHYAVPGKQQLLYFTTLLYYTTFIYISPNILIFYRVNFEWWEGPLRSVEAGGLCKVEHGFQCFEALTHIQLLNMSLQWSTCTRSKLECMTAQHCEVWKMESSRQIKWIQTSVTTFRGSSWARGPKCGVGVS